jgi:uncharacterized protein (TIGR02246 family)
MRPPTEAASPVVTDGYGSTSQRSLIGSDYQPIRGRGQLFWVCGRDNEEIPMKEPADVHPAYLKAFNAGDIDATVACYESQACFISKSGRVAHGTPELRKLYRAIFSYKPHLKLEVRKIIQAGDDLALVIVEWKSKAVLASGEIEALSGIATDVVRKQLDGRWKLAIDNPYGIEQKG